MSSITAQQTKLDLELVPKENRLDIGKCNGRIPRGLTTREPTFQVILDAIALTPCYPAFLITTDVPEGRDFDALPSEEDTVSFLRELGHTGDINSLNDVVVDQMHQPWRTFAALINRGLSGKTSGLDKLRLSRAQIIWGMYYQKNVDYVELLWEDFIYQIDNKVYKKQEKMYYPRFTKAIIHHFLIQDKTLSWRNKIGMHTSKDDYLITTLRFVSAKEATKIYGAILHECLTSLEMKKSKAYKTYLGYATDEEPIKKGKRVKRPAKKFETTPAAGIVLREAHVETKSKRKEKVNVTRGKGIELLSEVAFIKEAQMKEITPTVTSKGTGVKPGFPDVTKDDSTESESESWGNDEDEGNDDNDSVSEGNDEENESDDDETQSDNEKGSDSEQDTNENESGSESDQHEQVEEGDEEKGMYDTTNKFDDDVDVRLNEPTQTDKEVVQHEVADAKMNDAQQGNENLVITQEQVIEDAHVTILTVAKETEVPVTSSSHSSDLASKFLNFADILHHDAEIVSPLDVHVHHEVPSTLTPTLLTVPVLIITESSPVYTNIPQSSQTFTPPPLLSTPTPPPTIETTNPLSTLPDFTSVFRFNDRITTLEKEVAELKKDPLHTQVTALVDDHLDTRMGATREEFINFLLASLTTRIIEQVKNQLPQILPAEVSKFAPPVIEKMVEELLKEVPLAKVSSQPQLAYEAATTLTEFELKKILIDKMNKSESYLNAPEHRECYDGLINRKDKDADEGPSAGSDRGLKKRKTSKDAEPTTSPKNKDSTSGSPRGTMTQPKSSGKTVQSEEPEFEVADSDMPQDQEGNLGNDVDEPRKETASRRDWFTKPTPPQEPTDPDWNVGKTPQKGPTQNWLTTLAASTSTDKSLKSFDELMSTPIDFSTYILNGLKITNLTQETLLGPAFRLLKGTRTNFAELEYEFEECYKALSEKLDWENLEGGDYPFDLSKPLPLVMSRNRQRVPVDYFINNDLKYLQGGVSTMTYTTSITKTKAAKYDLPGIEDMVPNIWSPVKVAYDKHVLWGISHWREQRKSFYGYARGLQSRGDVYCTKRILAVTHVNIMRKHGYGYLEEIEVRRADNDLYRFKEGDFLRLWINDIEDMLLLVVQNRLTNLSGDDVADFAIALRMFTKSLVIQKRVEDLQLGVESYQKQINVIKPDTTRSDLRKKHPYTPYKDP
ncbi:hypothetical protein Tco_0312091 [Tanacetum coccineum]